MKRSVFSPIQAPVLVSALCGLLLFSASDAMATNGYFAHGYGTKAKGRGGVSLAIADDATAGANNPAILVEVGNRVDAAFEIFVPKRGAQRTNGFDFKEDSDRDVFVIPDLAMSKTLSKSTAIGLHVYGNGGLNTEYQEGDSTSCPIVTTSGRGNPFCGQGAAGVNLEQLVLAPTLSYKLNKNHSVGISPLFVYQRFAAMGLQFFGNPLLGNYSSDPDKLTNNGTSTSFGKGYRLGYFGNFDQVTVGAAYSPRINMSKFKEYSGLFAGQGDFDIPTNYGVGVAFRPTPRLLVGFDYSVIKFSEVPSVGNPSTSATMGCNCLGNEDGPGFGWGDVKVKKFAVEYKLSPKLSVRGGFNKGDNPVSARDVSFNILAPGVVTKHYTLGGTYKVAENVELSGHYMRATEVNVSGASILSLPGINPRESIYMHQNSLSFSLGVTY